MSPTEAVQDNFAAWMDCAREWCIEACGANPGMVTTAQWLAYYRRGMSAQEAGALVAKLIT